MKKNEGFLMHFLAILFLFLAGGAVFAQVKSPLCDESGAAFPFLIPEEKPDRPLSLAMERLYDQYGGSRPDENELFSIFRYTEPEGFDYHGHDGTISRRDPSKVILVEGKYYVWYTRRNTSVVPVWGKTTGDTIPAADWDLSEIWYATSDDGFTWEEKGVAINRPPKPHAGWRSVSTPDILVWKGKYYLYYQGFLEPPGPKGDNCPVTLSWSDSPDGPWEPALKIIVPEGAEGEWDHFNIHDPYPLVYKGRIYLYYKSNIDKAEGKGPTTMNGLAIADDPLGPFRKSLLNPVLNSCHETGLFPFREGIAALVTRTGNEFNTIQFAPDGKNFSIAAITTLMPKAPGPYVPDAFSDNGDGRGISWGLSHLPHVNPYGRHFTLVRFDCDLSLDLHDPQMKRPEMIHLHREVYLRDLGLTPAQKKRLGVE